MTMHAQKFALLDMDYILKNIPAYERANEQLAQVSKKWQAEVEALQTEAQTMYKDYQKEVVFLSQEQKKARQDAIMEKEREASELKKKYFGPEGELFKKRTALMSPIQEEIYNAVSEIADLRGYQLVLDRASDSGIIFGIDSTKCTGNPLAFPFSKTYRVMTAGTDFGEGAVHTAGGSLLSLETGVVKFYGHSLGEADYAYFQAIFDSVSLYDSDVKLVFYYKPHVKPGEDSVTSLSDQRAKNTMATRVAKLLAEYGNTLDNENHGRNLMHKLMIEGRVVVWVFRTTSSNSVICIHKLEVGRLKATHF